MWLGEKFQGFLANLPTLSKYINSNFDGLSFKDIELDQFSIDDKQEEIEVIAVFRRLIKTNIKMRIICIG